MITKSRADCKIHRLAQIEPEPDDRRSEHIVLEKDLHEDSSNLLQLELTEHAHPPNSTADFCVCNTQSMMDGQQVHIPSSSNLPQDGTADIDISLISEPSTSEPTVSSHDAALTQPIASPVATASPDAPAPMPPSKRTYTKPELATMDMLELVKLLDAGDIEMDDLVAACDEAAARRKAEQRSARNLRDPQVLMAAVREELADPADWARLREQSGRLRRGEVSPAAYHAAFAAAFARLDKEGLLEPLLDTLPDPDKRREILGLHRAASAAAAAAAAAAEAESDEDFFDDSD
jgi:hypothetical protein